MDSSQTADRGELQTCNVRFHTRKYASVPAARAGEYGVDDFVEWDVVNWAKALSFWKRQAGAMLPGADVLEVGCRDCGISLWPLSAGARHVVCTDLGGPSQTAVDRHERYLVSGRVEHCDVDVTRMPFRDQFDVVIFKSVLGGIGGAGGSEGQRQAVAQMHAALRPGGVLLFAENMVSSPIHGLLRRRFVTWGDRWLYVDLPSLAAFLAPFERVELNTAGFLGAVGRTDNQRRILGSLDSLVGDWVVPRSWNYIAFGAAFKSGLGRQQPTRGMF